jgi:hypothetical protein
MLTALALVAATPAAEVPGNDRAEVALRRVTEDAGAAQLETRRPPRVSATREEIRRLIDHAARRHGVEAALVHAVVAAESDYVIHAVSSAGAVGLMQVMPATASDYGVGSRAALFDPATNIDTGVRHLKRLLRKYRGDYGRTIMAYNAGEGVVDRTDGQVRFAETLNYTENVVGVYRQLRGTKETEQILLKVAALRQPSGSAPVHRTPEPEPDVWGLLPAASPRLEARLPKARLDGPLLETAGNAAPKARPGLGPATRTGLDPAIRATAPAMPKADFGAPTQR